MPIPSGVVPVATAPLVPPFLPVVFYANPTAPVDKPELGFNNRSNSYVLVTPAVPVPITQTFENQPNNPTTVVFSWDSIGGSLGIAYYTGSYVPVAGLQTTVPVQAASSATTVQNPTASSPSDPLGSPAPSQTSQLSASPTASISTAPKASISTTPIPNNGLSDGAVAGVAIGCLLGGAIIAGLLAWFFLRKRKPAGVRDSEASSMALIHREKGPTAKAVSLENGSPIAAALENGLPLPLEDKAITGEISKISNLIKNHVQSYYHAGRVSPVLIDYDDLQALGSDMPVSVGTLSTLLGNSATREIALRFCIAWIVVSRMQLDSPPNSTFLPPEISKCFQAMTPADRGSRVHAAYFAKWRAVTAELMQSTYVRNPFSATDARLYNLQAAADLLNNVLRPYSDSRMDDGQRSRNLEEILKRSALFAFTLFSQPCSWDFDWQNEQDVKSGSLCVFPVLLQVKDENGEPIKPARPFNEAVVRRLDE